jgi:DNA-binding NarL/FixJ family response regulator
MEQTLSVVGKAAVIRKVLIVDDSKLARMAVAKVLGGLHPDWVLLEASNAEQARTCVRQDSPDFVILDFNMPGQDGLSLAAEMRGEQSARKVAVISANHQIEVVNRARQAGAAFLRKPLTEQALAEFLHEASDRDGAFA